MYIIDGIAYAGEPVAGIRVTSVKPVGRLSMLVTFSTGETRLFDASSLIDLEAFRSLQDDKVFSNPTVDHGVVTWEDGDIDISPDHMYAMSYPYERIA